MTGGLVAYLLTSNGAFISVVILGALSSLAGMALFLGVIVTDASRDPAGLPPSVPGCPRRRACPSRPLGGAASGPAGGGLPLGLGRQPLTFIPKTFGRTRHMRYHGPKECDAIPRAVRNSASAMAPLVLATCRPFFRQWLYLGRQLNERMGQIPRLFPDTRVPNWLICVPGRGGDKGFSALLLNSIPDL
ncbi:hypothetical protein GI374_09430 [Paracoccus sp. S-4012]|uniref:type ISP restriction/modification enzyme n=1 Tax=Paracoccus sp. S-4012 TaxID=2665648 RepID=UPI0012AF2335|nr:type ISP restriction/modification enzyme [Paracoccus sp. S-4012]MRX50662.1 hypothetical protein [Paracoccus sp. S-4012]